VRSSIAFARLKLQDFVKPPLEFSQCIPRFSAQIAGADFLHRAADESAFADIQDQLREKEQRVSEIVDEMNAVSSLLIDELDVRDALGRFDEVWTALSPAERAKAIHQIVDSIQYDGHSKELSISYHPIGVRTFSQEQQSKEGTATC
jgi:hypothetical protein